MLKRPLVLVADFLLLMALVSQVCCIVGGEPAEEGQFPWAVALFYNNQSICTASIISPTDVLTAAHCVVLDGVVQPANAYHGIANVDKNAPEVRIEFSSLTPHPDYGIMGQMTKNDLAVLRMSYRLETGVYSRVAPICIAAPDSDNYQGAVAMGWGINYRILSSVPDTLQYVSQDIVNNNECSRIYPGLSGNNLCAKKLGRGICHGDGGGPLVHFGNNTVPVQIGIASFLRGAIVGCGTVFPAGFTRVSAYNDFILQNTADRVCVYAA